MGPVNGGLIGYKFMGKAHSNAYKSVGMFFPLRNRVVMKAICGRDAKGAKKAPETCGWEYYEPDGSKLVWRIDKTIAGSGALGDIGAHITDLALFLIGGVSEVVADLKTFVKKRPVLESGSAFFAQKKAGPPQYGDVTVDDAALFIVRFANGAMGSFEATRFATGRKNANQFEIYGSRGALAFNLESLNELHYYSKEGDSKDQGFKRILVTEAEHPYISAWWPPGHIIGYEHTFINALSDFFGA